MTEDKLKAKECWNGEDSDWVKVRYMTRCAVTEWTVYVIWLTYVMEVSWTRFYTELAARAIYTCKIGVQQLTAEWGKKNLGTNSTAASTKLRRNVPDKEVTTASYKKQSSPYRRLTNKVHTLSCRPWWARSMPAIWWQLETQVRDTECNTCDMQVARVHTQTRLQYLEMSKK